MSDYIVKIGPYQSMLIETNADTFKNFCPADLAGIPVYFVMQDGLPKVWPKPSVDVIVYKLVEQPVL